LRRGSADAKIEFKFVIPQERQQAGANQMYSQAEISPHQLSTLGVCERRMLINCLASILAVQAHDLAVLGRTDLVRPILEVKAQLQAMSEEMAWTQAGFADDIVSRAAKLVKAARHILDPECLLMTIH
jgi:hypothetical protein